MIFLDVLYVGTATIVVMALLQVIMYAAIRIMYPPEPKIIYREVPVQQALRGAGPRAQIPLALY
jgi:hypothetical protein